MRPPPPPSPRATTIVELLVVLAGIALLLGLLLPALSIVSAAGRSTQCRSNLRQMTLAAQQYASIFESWPPAILYEQHDGQLQQVAWDWITTAFNDELIAPGLLWTFTDSPGEAMQCPDYVGATNFAGDPFTGYNYNTTYIGDEEAFTPTGAGPIRTGVALHAARRGSLTAMFGDGGWAGGTNKFMRAPMNSEAYTLSTIYSGGQAFRHVDSTNVAYLDGHVDSVDRPRTGELATDDLLEQFMGYPDNGFLSDDDGAYDPR